MMFVLCILASLGLSHGAIMAVDLGSEWLKVSVVKPGRSPFSIVVNEMCAHPSPRSPISPRPIRIKRARFCGLNAAP